MNTDRVAVWLADHPTARRMVTVMTMVYGLSLWAVITAPSAAAATGAAALGWTGLRDTHNVPIHYYFLSTVPTSEAALNTDVDVSALDPSSWIEWSVSATQTAITYSTAAWWLGLVTGIYMFILGLAVWFVRFALSNKWLLAIAAFVQPLYNAVATLAHQLYLGPIAVTLCVMAAGYHMLRGQSGRGWAVIGMGAAITVVLLTVLRDPITLMFGDNGLLALGRSTGLQIAQGMTASAGTYTAGASLDAQIQTLSAQLVTSGMRHSLQVMNFGMVVDEVGSCGSAWTNATMAAQGVPGPGPAQAMADCGAPQALAHAQRLGGGDASMGLVFIFVAAVVATFFCYVGLSNMVVSIKAAYYGTVVSPAFLIGAVGFGRALEFAKHSGWQLVTHAVQMLAYTVYLAVSMIAIAWVLTTSLLGNATVTVVPRMLLMAVAAAALLLGFRVVDRSFRVDGMGTIGGHLRGALSAAGGAARRPVTDVRDDYQRIRERGGQWRQRGSESADKLKHAAAKAPGFDVFKPRAARSAATAGRQSTTSAAASSGAQTGAKTAATQTAARGAVASGAKSAATAAGTKVGAASAGRVAATAAAPQVAVPAAAAVAAAGVVKARRRRQNDDADQARADRRAARPAQNTAGSPNPPQQRGRAAEQPTLAGRTSGRSSQQATTTAGSASSSTSQNSAPRTAARRRADRDAEGQYDADKPQQAPEMPPLRPRER